MSPPAEKRLRVGLSACFFHADPERAIFNGRPLLYMERSMPDYLGSTGALVYLLPEPTPVGPSYADYAEDLDALVLQGGVDVSPRSYGEEPLREAWSGDALRDAYEIGLVHAFLELDKPVLGICRGHQLLNVALGGSLIQDIPTQIDGSLVHRDGERYQKNQHELRIEPGSWLSELYGGRTEARINSVHHQAIDRPGRGVVVEARSVPDGVIEAVRVDGPSWARGVQWHPEFSDPEREPELLDRRPLLESLLEAARARRER